MKAMMLHFLTDEVAQQFSMDDCKGKERFRGLKLCQVIVGTHFFFLRGNLFVPDIVILPDSVRWRKFLADSVQSEVEIHIREWLRRAKERAAFGLKKA